MNITPEKLNDSKMRKLFGTNHNGILYYNFDLNKWNRDNLMGYKIASIDATTNATKSMKTALENEAFFSDYELIAVVTMPTDTKTYSDWGGRVNNPVYASHGTAMVGTIVIRERATGKIMPVPQTWIGIDKYGTIARAAANGALIFAYRSANTHNFRRNLMKMHVR